MMFVFLKMYFFFYILDLWENLEENLFYKKMIYILYFVFVRVYDFDSEDKFFSIVIIEDVV